MKATTALKKIARLRKRIRVIQGGQGSGKTYSILIILINHALTNPNKEIFIASAELTKMRITVIKDFVKIMRSFNLFEKDRFPGGTLYRFENGSFIKFIGLDKEDLGKGLRSDVIFLNEANKTKFEAYRELTSRANNVYLDFNPNAEFWAHEEVITRHDAEFIILTYKDNEYLSQSEVAEIELYKTKGFINPDLPDYDFEENIKNKYWANKWRVYGMGIVGLIDGVIFQNYSIVEHLDENAKYIGTGLDFGYTNDPTAIVDCYKLNNTLIFNEVKYQTGLTNYDIAQILKEGDIKRYVVADSAEPKSIEEIRRFGVNIKGATKGKDSIQFGIDLLQRDNFYVTKKSKNILYELPRYIYQEDLNGNFTNKPIDYNNHAIDAMRYLAMEHIGKPNKGVYHIY